MDLSRVRNRTQLVVLERSRMFENIAHVHRLNFLMASLFFGLLVEGQRILLVPDSLRRTDRELVANENCALL
jgi:hypothetical protein